MADNTVINSGSGGDTIASDDIGGAKYQRVKLIHGADGTNAGDVAAANGLPVDSAIRDDALSTLSESEGDRVELRVTSTGALWVSPVAGLAQKVLGTDTYTEATSQGVAIAAVRRDADTTLADTTNEFAPLIVDARGALKVEVFSGETLPVSGTVTANPQPTTSGGLSIARNIDLDNGTLDVVKGSAGQLYGWTITNTTTAVVYVKFYNATSGTLGTGTPVLTIGIPGNSSDDTTLAQSFGGLGIEFSTGICVGAGTGVADADNTDPGANGVISNIYYK